MQIDEACRSTITIEFTRFILLMRTLEHASQRKGMTSGVTPEVGLFRVASGWPRVDVKGKLASPGSPGRLQPQTH